MSKIKLSVIIVGYNLHAIEFKFGVIKMIGKRLLDCYSDFDLVESEYLLKNMTNKYIKDIIF